MTPTSPMEMKKKKVLYTNGAEELLRSEGPLIKRLLLKKLKDKVKVDLK